MLKTETLRLYNVLMTQFWQKKVSRKAHGAWKLFPKHVAIGVEYFFFAGPKLWLHLHLC